MSGQQSPVAPESSKSEAIKESSTEAKPDSYEDGEQLWKDIQAQTGFESYREYVGSYEHVDKRSDLTMLRRLIDQASDRPRYSSDACCIVDVLAREDSPPKLSTCYHCESSSKVLAALHQPPKHVCVRVLFWPISHRGSFSISRDFLDRLGLALRIDPQIFLALIETLRELDDPDVVGSVVDTRPLRHSHVVIGKTVATFVDHYPFGKPAAVPIVLVAGDISPSPTSSSEQLARRDFACVAHQGIHEPPPFTYPNPSHRVELASDDNFRNIDPQWLHIYKETFRALAGNNPGSTNCTTAIIARVLMPLLRMNCLETRVQFLCLRRRFLVLQAAMNRDNVDHEIVNHTSSKLHQERFWLRRSVEDSNDGMNHFEGYISAKDANYIPESSAYLVIKQETGQIHEEARRLDAEVRDYLQLVVGNLSLEESRKSIELSNNQISLSNNQIIEAKRGL